MASLDIWETPSMLLNLPNEVLSYVVAGLTPDDMINTALSCKTMYDFCKYNGSLRRHMDHQKAYMVLNIGSHGLDPLDLLEKFNEDWRIAYYVKAVHFKCPKARPLFPRKPHGGARYLMNTTKYAKEAMLALLAPLLLLLPNLGRLRFIDFLRQPPGFKELLGHIDRRAALTKLQVVEFVRSDALTHLDIEWPNDISCFELAFNPWGFLPSVHTLRAENINWIEDSYDLHLRITSLELINCSIERRALEKCLKYCTNLKRFIYDWNLGQDLNQDLNELFKHHGLFYALHRCCRNSLEYVRITGGVYPWCLTGEKYDLTGLHRLKQTHLNLGLFVDAPQFFYDRCDLDGPDISYWNHRVMPLHEFLPPSTEEVTIDVSKTATRKRELNELLGHTVRNLWSQARLPLLKSVIVESDKSTADEVKKLTDYWQRQDVTIKMGLRIGLRVFDV